MRKVQISFFAAALSVLGFTSCQKDNAATVTVPSIVSPGLKNGQDTIYLGDSRVLSPQLANTKDPTFLWLVNGVQASTDSIFTFTPTNRGDYTISYKILSGNSMASYYYRIKVLGKYDNGFYIVNEGWLGHGPGDVNFYRNGEDSVYQNVFQRENPGKTLGTTTQYGAVFNGHLYLVSKQGPLVVADAFTMKETGRIPQLPADGRSFCGIDNNTGLIGTANGLYPLNLQTLTVGTQIAGVNGQIGGMLKAGNYVFVISQADGVVVLNAGDFSIAQKVVKADVGLTQTLDGKVWASGGNSLYAINPQTLTTDTIAVPFTIYSTWGWWNAGSLTASTAENVVFLAKTLSFGGGNEIYRYVAGNPASLQTSFITLPAGKQLYSAGIRYNSNNNTVVITGIKSPGYGQDAQVNTLYIYDASTAAAKKSFDYTGFFFPAMPVFN